METRYAAQPEHTAPRSRKKRQRKRLQSKFKFLLQSIPDVVVVDRDPLFQALLGNLTKQPPSIVNFQVICRGLPVTVVGVPTRIWVNPQAMGILMKVKQRMLEYQRICILLPQGAINVEPAQVADPTLVKQLFSFEEDNVGESNCAPQRGHDPVGCWAHLIMSGRPCPSSLT